MLTYQGCPQTPGGRMGARGRRRGPIPAMCHRYSSPVLYTYNGRKSKLLRRGIAPLPRPSYI